MTLPAVGAWVLMWVPAFQETKVVRVVPNTSALSHGFLFRPWHYGPLHFNSAADYYEELQDGRDLVDPLDWYFADQEAANKAGRIW